MAVSSTRCQTLPCTADPIPGDMHYSRVYLESIGYELAPVVVSTDELEARLEPLYAALRLPKGQLEALTGISERRWWPKDYAVSHGATLAALKALAASNIKAADIDVLIYAGVCREQLEPATACHVAAELGISTGRGDLRRQQRLPGRPERHRRGRQPNRAGPGAGRAGRLLRDGPRDQRGRHRPDGRSPSRWTCSSRRSRP